MPGPGLSGAGGRDPAPAPAGQPAGARQTKAGGKIREEGHLNTRQPNREQYEAITAADGPVLITAGPGTGKTYTLVQRTIYLIRECGVRPENIFLATFTDKAASELVTRITDEFASQNITANLNEMYVGTFHSLCLRILKEHLEHTRLRRNFRSLDSFDQQYMVYQNYGLFQEIEGFDSWHPSTRSRWRRAGDICTQTSKLQEELVSPESLMADSSPETAVTGRIYRTYLQLLEDGNMLDYSGMQTEAYRLLKENPDILAELQGKISHIMVDEYQDTNYIQEQLVFLLAGERQNICVVGDDDQGLYRFRGATIRNILEFPGRFAPGRCRTVSLVVNYRSNSDIIDFYNRWMSETEGDGFRFEWGNCRYPKEIKAQQKSTLKSSAVVKLTGADEEDWHEKLLDLILTLKRSGKIRDYNQIAFLFKSVKNSRVRELSGYLESHGVNVYSPRSDLFFDREEIRLAVGCLLLLFPDYLQAVKSGEARYLKSDHLSYYTDCGILAESTLEKPEYAGLSGWVRSSAESISRLSGAADWSFCGLLYRLFQYQPFAGMLDTDMTAGNRDLRPARNLAKLTQIMAKFEYLNNISVLNSQYLERDTESLFGIYLRLLYDGGIDEYEDDSEYAPSGCVSFLTIHQAKGLEFPIVIVGSLYDSPRNSPDGGMKRIEQKYFARQTFEPEEYIKYYDFWRLYYTAFSRAQNLLILSCYEDSRTPARCFRDLYASLPETDDREHFRLEEFTFSPVKDTNIKESYSFTSDVSVYETCPLQYKFYKELEFSPVRENASLFGTLVHETIEDVHRAALRHEEDRITEENVTDWFYANYLTLSHTRHSYLADPQLESARSQVLRYVERQKGDWSQVRDAEVDVSLVKPDYILDGKIDLIRGEGDTVEILDFKSEPKPDLSDREDRRRVDLYHRQLNIYAYLVEQRTGKKVSRLNLYYTSVKDGSPAITFPYEKASIDETVQEFDDTVHRIMNKDFRRCADNPRVCSNCDFRFYCGNRNGSAQGSGGLRRPAEP